MNIKILQDHIETFTREVVDSGFKRDLDDYIASLPNAQNSIITLRDIAGKVLSSLDRLYEGDLPDALRALPQKRSISSGLNIFFRILISIPDSVGGKPLGRVSSTLASLRYFSSLMIYNPPFLIL